MNKLLEKLKILEQLDCRMSNTEEWINTFMEELLENLDEISTENFNIKECLQVVLNKHEGTKEEIEEIKEKRQDILLYYQKQDKKRLAANLKKREKLEEFFFEWDI